MPASTAPSPEQTSRDKILDAAAALVAKRGYAAVGGLLREGMGAGLFRAVHVNHFLLTLVGIIVFPFASGEFGAEVLGKDLFDATEVRRRKREVRALLRSGLVASR